MALHRNAAVPVHIPALDGVRGMAVLLVFFFHYGGGLHSSFRPLRLFAFFNNGGWTGVTLFFVLSGFLITGILWDSFNGAHWWRNFFVRRALRIFPLYYAALALVVAGAIWVLRDLAVLGQIWIPALFLQTIPSLSGTFHRIDSPFGSYHLWSIAVEEQFYLLWPWLLYLVAPKQTERNRSNAKWLCLAVFLASAAFRIVAWNHATDVDRFSGFLPTQAGALAIGGWLALAYRGPEWPALLQVAPFFALFGAMGFLTTGLLSGSFTPDSANLMLWGLPFATVLYGAVVALAIRPGTVQRLFSAAWLRWIGGISYGIYIYHVLIRGAVVRLAQLAAGHHGAAVQNLYQFIFGAGLSVGLAFLSFHFFEKPILRLRRYFVTQRIAAPDRE